MTLETIWQEIRTHLEKEKNQRYQEIRNYPPPIPACDVQFNHLLEERAQITQELSRVREICQKELNDTESLRLLHEVIASCHYMDAALKAKLKADLQAVPTALES